MKLTDILNEIGEGTAKPYKYKLVADVRNDAMYYTFKTDPDPNQSYLGRPKPPTEYSVDLRFWDIENNKRSLSNIDVAFSTAGGEYEEETNDNNQYRVMATVVAIIKEALSKHPEIISLTFTPSKADKMDTRRANLYKAYIQKQIPNSTRKVLRGGGVKVNWKPK